MSPEHPLDRPIWSALTGRQASLAVLNGQAVRIRPDMGIFAAARDATRIDDLEALVVAHPGAGFLEVEGSAFVDLRPGNTPIALRAELVQMTAREISPGPTVAWEPLGEADAEDIYDLAVLTRPGPFRPRTMDFGGFIGVKNNGRLIAMAGTRLRCDGFSEVSAVCTHPDHRGRGLAKALMREVAGRIVDAGETAFLHAFADRAATIALYRTLGFEVRQKIVYTVLAEPASAL